MTAGGLICVPGDAHLDVVVRVSGPAAARAVSTMGAMP